MILPTKHLSVERSLLTIAIDVLSMTGESKTMSRLWEEFSTSRSRESGRAPVSYEWFILSLDLLFLLDAIDFAGGRVFRSAR